MPDTSLADQCAVGPDGKLLEAWQIEFRHDPDDPNPLPRVQPRVQPPEAEPSVPPAQEGRGFRRKDTTRFKEVLHAEKLDDNGQPIQKNARKPRQSKLPASSSGLASASAPIVIDSDPEDNDYEDDGNSDASSDLGSDIYEEDEVVHNSEIADALPSKTIPLTSAGKTKSRSKKRKAKSNPAPPSKKSHTDPPTVPNSPALVPLGPSSTINKTASLSSLAPSMDNKKNFIYLFYEACECDHDGSSTPDTKYYRCWHGVRQTFKLSKGMKYSLKNMVNHLSSKFPTMFQLYMSFQSRNSLPTPFEVKIAMAAKDITEKEVNEHLKSLKISDSSSASIQAAFDKQSAAAWDQSEFEKILAEWIVACDQPFDQVDHPAFRSLLQYVYSPARKPLSIPGRTTIRKRILKLGEDSIESMQQMFEELESKVSISLDAWTSPNQYAFLAIIAHYISNEGQPEEVVIDFKELIGEHSGENMAEIVWETLKLYKIENKIIAFVMDNATNNDTMLKGIEDRCRKEGIPFSAQDARGRCMPHTIHLAAILLLQEVQAISTSDARDSNLNYQEAIINALSDGEGVDEGEGADQAEDIASLGVNMSAVGRLRNVVRAIRCSPQRRQLWARTVILTHPKIDANGKPHIPKMPILDVRTRWGSTHDMLQRAIMYEASIKHFIAVNYRTIGNFDLSDDDWQSIKLIAGWLELFRSATTQMSSTRAPMISTTHAIFRGLQDQLKNILATLPNDVSPPIKSGILKAHRKLSDYFTKFDESPYYTWAAILDPRITYAELEVDYADDADLAEGLEQSKAALFTHFNTFYASSGSSSPAPSFSESSSSSYMQPILSRRSDSQTPSFDFTARFRRLSRQTSSNELDEYIRLPPQDFHSCNPMQWWYSQRHRFPRLYLLARDVLGIPGSAVAVERLFSGGRDTISLRRASLKPETIRLLMILKQHLRVRQSKKN